MSWGLLAYFAEATVRADEQAPVTRTYLPLLRSVMDAAEGVTQLASYTPSELHPQRNSPSELHPAPHRVYLPLQHYTVIKRGIGLTYGNCSDVHSVNAGWYYTWSPKPTDCWQAEGVPMLWGRYSHRTAQLGPTGYLLGWNEPDNPKQANIPACPSVAEWREIELAWPQRRLLSPAITDQPDWLIEFYNCYVAAYGVPPRWAGLATHCYRRTAAECIANVQRMIDLAQQWRIGEVWVTEFAFLPCDGPGYAAGSMAAALREAQMFMRWLDTQPMITRYAWFAARIQETEPWAFPQGCSTALFNADGSPTVFGEWYRER